MIRQLSSRVQQLKRGCHDATVLQRSVAVVSVPSELKHGSRKQARVRRESHFPSTIDKHNFVRGPHNILPGVEISIIEIFDGRNQSVFMICIIVRFIACVLNVRHVVRIRCGPRVVRVVFIAINSCRVLIE